MIIVIVIILIVIITIIIITIIIIISSSNHNLIVRIHLLLEYSGGVWRRWRGRGAVVLGARSASVTILGRRTPSRCRLQCASGVVGSFQIRKRVAPVVFADDQAELNASLA